MKTNSSLILGLAMIVLAVLMEVFWVNTGAEALGIFSLLAALTASGALARFIRLDYETSNVKLRKFLKVTGLEVEVKDNKKSRNPAYVLTIDFGEEIGIKKSSAQITTLYQPDDLIGMQVICCVNLTPMHIGSVKSEVRILGTESEQGVVLLQPTEKVKDGDRVF